jgi:hypothetical protein
VPFVEAGAAYLRQVYDTLELAATGQTFHVGGGAAVPLAARRGHRPALGLRVHARAVARRKGIALDGRSHISPAAGASLILRF